MKGRNRETRYFVVYWKEKNYIYIPDVWTYIVFSRRTRESEKREGEERRWMHYFSLAPSNVFVTHSRLINGRGKKKKKKEEKKTMALDCTFRIDTARSPCDTTTTPTFLPLPLSLYLSIIQLSTSLGHPFSSPLFNPFPSPRIFYLLSLSF